MTPSAKPCPTCGQEPRLSDAQRNEYYRMIDVLLQHPKITHVGKNALDLYFRYQFLTAEEVTLPNGKVERITPSLSRVKGPDVSNMSDYIDKCRERVDEWGLTV